MMYLHKLSRSGSRWLLPLFGALALGLAQGQPVQAAEISKARSVNLVPDDAAFYTAMLRNKEQLDMVLHSQAWAKLKTLPMVKTVWQKLQEEIKNNPGTQLAVQGLQQQLQQPENRQLLQLLGDMVSEEIFAYGDQSWIEFFDLLTRLSNAVGYGPALSQITNPFVRTDPSKLLPRSILKVLTQNPKLLKIPDLVIGFKITKPARAEAQIARLESLLKAVLAQNPLFKERLTRKKVGGADFLTLTLDGSLVPWDRIPFKDIEEEAGQYDELVKKLQKIKLVIGIGVRDGYVLVTCGGSSAGLAKLGKGKPLAGRQELQPLAKFADKRLTSIDYLSKELRAKVGTSKADIDNMVAMAKELLQKAPIPADKTAQIEKDLKALAKDLKSFIPQPGAEFGVSFLTDRGQESYSYDWQQQLYLDGSRTLTLLHHVGGSPLVAVVARAKYKPENYRMLVKWLKVADRYFEELVVDNFLTPDQKEKYQDFTKVVYPLLKRLDEATSKMLIPALRDGQQALVLDAKIKSKHWLQFMPETEQPLPMLEPALIHGVSDASLLRRAFDEYRSIINEAIAKARELGGGVIPEFEIPAPNSRNVKNGVLYYYDLPPILGLDEQILPNAGLSQKVAVLAISAKQSERLLAATPLKVRHGPLADSKRHLAMAVYVDWSGIVDALTPWVELGLKMAGPRLLEQLGQNPERDGKDDKAIEDVIKQVRTILDVLKVVRRYTSATYFENGVLVTHGETVIRDLK